MGSSASNALYVAPTKYAQHRAQQRAFQSSAGRIAYTDHGDGAVLVLLHGVPSSSWLYRKMIPGLQSDFRVIAVDLLGYGSSDKPNPRHDNYSASSQADYVEQLLQSLGVQRANLVFHDMGGLVAWELTARALRDDPREAPGEGETIELQIDGLVVLNTIISRQGFNHPDMEPGMIAKQVSKAYTGKRSAAAILKMTFANMGLTNNAKLSERECRGYVYPLQEGSDHALYDFFTGFNQQRFDSLATNISRLDKFAGRAIVLWGEQDRVLTTGQIPVLRQHLQIDSSDVTIYPNQSHFLPEEIPQLLVDKIVAALR